MKSLNLRNVLQPFFLNGIKTLLCKITNGVWISLLTVACAHAETVIHKEPSATEVGNYDGDPNRTWDGWRRRACRCAPSPSPTCLIQARLYSELLDPLLFFISQGKRSENATRPRSAGRLLKPYQIPTGDYWQAWPHPATTLAQPFAPSDQWIQNREYPAAHHAPSKKRRTHGYSRWCIDRDN